MKEYSPKRRTAVVFAGSGTSGAYHAGVLKALDESGVKIDLVVGSGVGVVTAAFAAAAGGPRLYGKGGFWDGASWSSFYRLRMPVRVGALLLGVAFLVFVLPLLLAVLAGLLFPIVLVVDSLSAGFPSQLLDALRAAPAALRIPYLAALAAPSFVFSVLALAVLVSLMLRHRRRAWELFESVLDAEPARARLRHSLGEVTRGPSFPGARPSDAELGRRYVALACDNLGQPGFRELILRTADLETGAALPFVLLEDEHKEAFATARIRGPRSRSEGLAGAVDLRTSGYDELMFDAVMTGLLPPPVAPVRRVSFPRRGIHAGETHRLCDATAVGGCGISEALAAGAEQIVFVSAVPDVASPPPRRRGPLALADSQLATLERRGVEEDLRSGERMNRIVETLGRAGPDDEPSWEDPATGRRYRSVGLYVIRPELRYLGPLELSGARDPATEVVGLLEDLVEQGFRDAYREFIEPVVGAALEPDPEEVRNGVEL
jgi:hypothetical protein